MVTALFGRWAPMGERLDRLQAAARERWRRPWRPAAGEAVQAWSHRAADTGRARVGALATGLRRVADRLDAVARQPVR